VADDTQKKEVSQEHVDSHSPSKKTKVSGTINTLENSVEKLEFERGS
jgi:hypothetical protein